MLNDLLMTSRVGGDRDERENLVDAPRLSWEEMLDAQQLEVTPTANALGIFPLLNVTPRSSLWGVSLTFSPASFPSPPSFLRLLLALAPMVSVNDSAPKSHCHLGSVLCNLSCRETENYIGPTHPPPHQVPAQAGVALVGQFPLPVGPPAGNMAKGLTS